MKREQIIRMAREAGGKITAFINYDYGEDVAVFYMEDLHSFAALVRADERERIISANAPEIERCNAYIKELEEAIRARGNT
jgi:hypothetical protein